MIDTRTAPADVVRAAIGAARFSTIKGNALATGRDVAEAFAAELTEAERERIAAALDGPPLDHDALEAGLGRDRYFGIAAGAIMPSTRDADREAVIRAALAFYTDPITGQTVAELMAPPPAEAPAPAPARRPGPPVGPATRRVAGAGERDFRYVGLVRIAGPRGTGPIVTECGHEHANRDWSTGAAGGSAKDCARSIIAGAQRPETAEYTAKRIRSAPLGLRAAAGFQHPAGTIEAARAIAEANADAYLAAVAAVREHLAPTPPAPVTDATTAAADDEPETTCPCCGCPAYEEELISVRGSDPACWECRREME